jgi:serine/threonine-protein kinase
VSEDLTGRRLGHYRIEGVIGRGGMSVLYRATDMRLGRRVALKVIGDQLAADPEFRERFVDEARNTSAVDHAHVVPLYDFDEVDGQLYIAMRYVEGSDLASLIKDGPLSSTRTLTLLEQIADALDALHGRGLVHLDVKPANVLVTQKESAGTEHVYLADFGLTRRGATGHRTGSGDFLGSPTYAAPEHLRGEPVDGRTDQYSLTCVLFACLTGRPPFTGKVSEVIAGHLGLEPPTITRFALLPGPIADVVRRGLAKEPGRRYTSCRELMAAARAALATAPTPPVPSSGAGPPGAYGALPPSESGAGPPGASGAVPPGAVSPGQPAQPAVTGGWTTQTPAPTPPGGHAQPGAQQPGGHPPPGGRPPYPSHSSQQPIRLRDPLPVHSDAFATAGSGGSRWIPATLGALAVIVIIVVIILAMNRGQGGGQPGQTTTPSPTTSPASTTSTSEPSSSRGLPTHVPTVTS